MKKELLLAFLSVAINGSAANDEIVKAGSTATFRSMVERMAVREEIAIE